ncbi:MlaD family protein [Mycobacteroides abscessus]|uniref:MlaD family protein n=1 Tax=Mycobacteroides abscessus TaxID=36809 RepID=UPI00078DF1BA|nr:MlaD family protein [Mycobacteroides abscessus]AMU75759.1 Mce family protein [Mycobacteroides abscessus]ANO24704.1 Mce family protein [Mycobacteroides abscessus]
MKTMAGAIRNVKRVRVGSVVSLSSIAAILVLGTAYLTFGLLGVDWARQYTTVSIDLPDAVNLLPRSPVLLSGVKVGQVAAVTGTPTGVSVEVKVDRSYQVPVDSAISIEQLSALGEPYIEFQPRVSGGPFLTDGQRILAKDVTVPASIPDLARAITTLLEQLDPQAIRSIVTTFNDGMAGTDEVIPQLSRASNLLAATLESREPQLRAILKNAQVPGPDVAKAGADLIAAAPQWVAFGVKARGVVDSLSALLHARPVPTAYTTGNGLLDFLPKVKEYLNRVGPELVQLYPALEEWLDWAIGEVPGSINVSELVDQALHSTGPDGSLQLQINTR